MTAAAVITADIVNSTRLSRLDNKKLMKILVPVLEPHKYEFYRGDSFQVYVKSPVEALWVVLQARTGAMKLLSTTSIPVADIRSSIGIGTVKFPIRSLQTATDEAFVLSGRAFDKMEEDRRLVISCNEKNYTIDLGLKVVAHFIDYIFQRLTVKQAGVVFELLMKRTQVETAKRLKKSQATVHKHTQSAGWPDIEKLLKEYGLLTDSIEL